MVVVSYVSAGANLSVLLAPISNWWYCAKFVSDLDFVNRRPNLLEFSGFFLELPFFPEVRLFYSVKFHLSSKSLIS